MKPCGLWWSSRKALLSDLIREIPDWEWVRPNSPRLEDDRGARGKPRILLVDHQSLGSEWGELPWKTVPQLLRSAGPFQNDWIWVQVLPAEPKRALEMRTQCAKAGCFGFVAESQNYKEWQAEIRRALEALRDPVLRIMRRVQAISGVVLPEQKRALVESRLARRAIQLGHRDLEQYLEYFLLNSEKEMTEVLSSVTTHTTQFFRDPRHFEFLKTEAVPRILEARRAIRVWSAACSTGQEPVSLAICLHELSRRRASGTQSSRIPPFSWTILATDSDALSARTAAQAVYFEADLKGVPREALLENFDLGTGELSGWWRLKDELHRRMSFRTWNLLEATPPVNEVDLLFLRNVLMYFQQDEITAVLAKLVRCLAPGGYLFVGQSESFTVLGQSLDLVGAGIYRRPF